MLSPKWGIFVNSSKAQGTLEQRAERMSGLEHGEQSRETLSSGPDMTPAHDLTAAMITHRRPAQDWAHQHSSMEKERGHLPEESWAFVSSLRR